MSYTEPFVAVKAFDNVHRLPNQLAKVRLTLHVSLFRRINTSFQKANILRKLDSVLNYIWSLTVRLVHTTKLPPRAQTFLNDSTPETTILSSLLWLVVFANLLQSASSTATFLHHLYGVRRRVMYKKMGTPHHHSSRFRTWQYFWVDSIK